MRKNSARKWLHATLDLLPVVIIPIFALYSTNKNATFAQEITVSENKIVDFNQLIQFDTLFNSYSGINLASVTKIDNYWVATPTDSTQSFYTIKNPTYTTDIYVWRAIVSGNQNNATLTGTLWTNTGSPTYSESYTNIIKDIKYTFSYRFYGSNQNGNFTLGGINNSQVNIYSVNLFNLTQMFGVGNEPTLEQFNEWYPNDYYDYTLSQKQLLKDYDQITYNDTDIGSQFIYGLYNSVDKYFNIGNVFNLGSIYDWLNLNIFNGNAPIAIYIVWNIVAYEFLMDLLFLLYGLFMFFIDTCTNLMDRFYCNLSGRR